MAEAQQAALPDLGKVGPFLQAVGLELEEVDGRRVAGHAELSADHHTPWGVVHGGVYTTIIESVASIGASAAVRERGQFAVGVNNTTDFLRSMTAGRVDVVGDPLSQGRVQQLWQVVITRAEDGKTVARGTVRLQNVDFPAS
jgi:1,4-dihydroxy-2-naphthoyl-CoA hydrolase